MKIQTYIAVHRTILNEETTEIFFSKEMADSVTKSLPNVVIIPKTLEIPDEILAKVKRPTPRKKQKVTTICYGKRDTWNSAKDALDYFNEAANCSDGCERERYLTIVSKLLDGATDDVSDEW